MAALDARLDLVLGIDSSTQGTSAVLLDSRDFKALAEARIRYRDDPRLSDFGLDGDLPILPPSEPGEAAQPAILYLAALEAILGDLPRELLGRVAAIAVSAQQHGQVWLGQGGREAIAGLAHAGSGAAGSPSLAARVGPGLAWDRAPIWMSANSAKEAAALRAALGGPEAMTRRSGSDSPLRFTGPVLMRSAKCHTEAWRATRTVHLLSSFLAGLLAANPDCPIDWGNGSGTSLMNWKERRWDAELVAAAARDIGDSPEELGVRLPRLAHPLARAGRLAAFFVEGFGMSPSCEVLVGSGDNPHSKALAEGGLLSLGTSFVLMAEGEKPHAGANAMYDGLGRPFLFGCRTNGSLIWERVRRDHRLAPDDFEASDRALAAVPPGGTLRLLQLERESFPVSTALDVGRDPDFRRDYAGVVDSSLGLLWLASRPFAGSGGTLAVTGGGSASRGVLERVASIWKTRVLPLADAGAARGAALAAALSLLPEGRRLDLIEGARAAAGRAGPPIDPDPSLVVAYHGEGGYLARLERKAGELGIALEP